MGTTTYFNRTLSNIRPQSKKINTNTATPSIQQDTIIRREPTQPHTTIRELGHGGFGTVYLVEDMDGQLFARKEIRIPMENRQKFLEAMVNEVKIQQSLSTSPRCNDNIVCIYDYFYTGDYEVFNIIMEYVDDKLDDVRGDKRVVKRLLTQAISTLDYIHKQGVLHRDIKPDNMLYDGKNIKFTDFGISCIIRACQGLAGTMGYIDPYCLSSRSSVQNTFSDIYSLGITAYYLYFGKRYFDKTTPVMDQYEDRYTTFASTNEIIAQETVPYLIYTMINPFQPAERPTLSQARAMIVKRGNTNINNVRLNSRNGKSNDSNSNDINSTQTRKVSPAGFRVVRKPNAWRTRS